MPLPDLTTAYRGFDFGLYPGRRTTAPERHLAAGLERAQRIRPLDADGRPSDSGRIVLLSIGMSNTSSEFARFVADAGRNRAINRSLTILNGSLSGADAAMWTNPDGPAWRHALSTANGGRGTSARQVQVVWIKQTNLKTAPFPQEVDVLQNNLASILRIARTVFPNLQMAFVSSRTRAGAESRRGPGEPQAYETAFAVRALIGKQIESGSLLSPDAVWADWGPYLWSNGSPRSDGFVWDCADVRDDMLHPTASGDRKVADQLMAFFMTRPTTVPWFLDRSAARAPGARTASASVSSGSPPLAVEFAADVPGAVQYYWSFADGTFASGASPRKTFHVGGQYDVRLTAVDAAGRWTHSSLEVTVGAR